MKGSFLLASPSQQHQQALETSRNLLQDPLTGRSVMIPCTSQAFFEGQLDPSLDKDGNECVVVKLKKDTMVEMTRDETLELFQKRIASVKRALKSQSAKKKVDPQKTKKQPNKSNIEEKPPAATTSKASDPPAFFEIREELDKDGKEIRAEAVNIASELKYLEAKEAQQLDSKTTITPTFSRKQRQKDTDDDVQEEQQEGGTPPTMLSDNEYDKLSKRLDELALLEEKGAEQKRINKLSSKKLQGSGWGRGFLNAKPKAVAKKKKKKQSTDDTRRTKKVVQVDETKNQVQEIPRVGERSVASGTLRSPTSTNGTKPFSKDVFSGVIQERPVPSLKTPVTGSGIREGSKPLEKEIFSGVVQERPVSKFAAQQQQKPKEKKKLSKFAQQRQQQFG